MTAPSTVEENAIAPGSTGPDSLISDLSAEQFVRLADLIVKRGQGIESDNRGVDEDDRTLFDLAFMLDRDASRLLASPAQISNLRQQSQEIIKELSSAAVIESDPTQRQKFRSAVNYLSRGLEDLPVLEGAYNRLARSNISAIPLVDSLIESASDVNIYRRIRAAAEVGPETPIDDINDHIHAARRQLARFAGLENSRIPSLRDALTSPTSELNSRVRAALAYLDDAQARLNDPAQRAALDLGLRRVAGIDQGIKQGKETIEQLIAADPRAAVLKELKTLTLVDPKIACGNPVEDLRGSLHAYDAVNAIHDLQVNDGKASLDRILNDPALTSGMPEEQLTELQQLRATCDEVDSAAKRSEYALNKLGLRAYIENVMNDAAADADSGEHYLYKRLGLSVAPGANGTISMPTRDQIDKAYSDRRRLLQHAATRSAFAADPDAVDVALEGLREAHDKLSRFSFKSLFNAPTPEAEKAQGAQSSEAHSNANWLSRSIGDLMANDKFMARAGTVLTWGAVGTGLAVGAWCVMSCVPGLDIAFTPVDAMGSVLNPIAGALGIPDYLIQYTMVWGFAGGVLAPLGGLKAAGYIAPKVAGEVISIYRNKTDNVIELLKQEFTEPERVATKLSEYRQNLAELLGVSKPVKKRDLTGTQMAFLDIDIDAIHPQYRGLFELHRKICLLESQVFISELYKLANGAINFERQKPDGERDEAAIAADLANLDKIVQWQNEIKEIKANSKFKLTEEDGTEKEVQIIADDLRGKWSDMVGNYSIFSSIKPNVQGQKRKDYDLMRQLEAAMRAEQSALRLASQWAQTADPIQKHTLVQRMKGEAVEVIRNAKEGAGPDTNMQIFNHRERTGAAGTLWAFTQGPLKAFGPPPKSGR